MSKRQVKRRRMKKTAVGDLRSLITVWERKVEAPTASSVSVVEAHENPEQEWAKVETVGTMAVGQNRFDGVNLNESGHSHVFTLRYTDTYTAENIVEWEGDFYDILETDNPDGRFEYLELFCIIKGDKNLEANR